MTQSKVILIIEDEVPIRDMIQFALMPAGFDVREAGDINEANKQIAIQIPDLILLDWMLPGTNGIEFAKQLKKNAATRNVPIIMLTARAEEENKIRGFEAGVDDYVTKPFSPRELIARIRTILRRGLLLNSNGIIQFDQLCLNIDTREVTINGHLILLTPIEYKLLHFFMMHQNRVYSRSQLLNHVWGEELYINERTVDVHVRRLRAKLKYYGCDTYIKTIHGVGYKFI